MQCGQQQQATLRLVHAPELRCRAACCTTAPCKHNFPPQPFPQLTVPSTLTATGCTPLRIALYTVPKPPAPSRHSLPSGRLRIWISARGRQRRRTAVGATVMPTGLQLNLSCAFPRTCWWTAPCASSYATLPKPCLLPTPHPVCPCAPTLRLDLPVAEQRGQLLGGEGGAVRAGPPN